MESRMPSADDQPKRKARNAIKVTPITLLTELHRSVTDPSNPTAALGIASVLVVSVVQKSKEIGILRAMGTSRGQVLRVFLLQGGVMGLAGSLAGSALGRGFLLLWRGVARNADGTQMFIVLIEPMLFAIAAAGATFVGILSAVAPARRAAKLDPAVAIRG